MIHKKVVFGFFIAMTLNFGFFIGGLTDLAQLDVLEMFAAIVVSLIASVLKFGDRTQIAHGAVWNWLARRIERVRA